MEERPSPQAVKQSRRECPECGHQFQGNGFDGIDAHWRAKHNVIMPYEEAWPLIRDGRYLKSVTG